jgi:transcription antitermination factor NusG
VTWHAIRTSPGAQQPQREFVVEPTKLSKDGRPIGKGYRIVPSLNPGVSAIERSLADNGFRFYMPCDKIAVRDRRKTGVWTTRRFPLLRGYVFVHDPHDWRLLDEMPGVVAIVGSKGGEPYSVDLLDIIRLRSIEAVKTAEADEAVAKRNRLRGAKASTALKATAKLIARAKRQIGPGSRVDVLWGKAIGRQATVIGWEDDGRLKAIADGLDALGAISVPVDAVRMAAA